MTDHTYDGQHDGHENGASSASSPEPPGAPSGPGIIPDTDATEIDSFLSGYGSGYQVCVIRTAPLWCAGFLTTVPLDHGISLAEIKESWGGRRFQLRIQSQTGKYIAMRTTQIADVPRENGQPITQLDHVGPGAAMREAAAASSPVPGGASADVALLAGVVRDVMTRQQSLLERMMLAPPEAPLAFPPQRSAADAIAEVAGMMNAIKEIAGGFGNAPDASSATDAIQMKMFEKLIDKWGDKRTAERDQPRRQAPERQKPRVVIRHVPAPAASGSAPAASGSPPGAPAPGPEAAAASSPPGAQPGAHLATVPEEGVDESATVGELTTEDITDALLDMPVEQAARAIREVFDNLRPHEQQQAVDILLGSGVDESATPGIPSDRGSSSADQG